MNDWQTALRAEFEFEEGSFLLKMRCEMDWDVDAYDRLIAAMEACCRAKTDSEFVERWVAEGFWYVSWYVKDWTTHPNFPRWRTEEYYEAAYQYLDSLALCFFGSDVRSINESARTKISKLRDTLKG